jgi:hypothetical protein
MPRTRTALTRRLRIATALAATAALSGCSTFEFLTDNCTSEFVRVSWPVKIVRGTTTTDVTLFGSVSPGNIDPTQFELLRDVLVNGSRSTLATVVWTVPAFEINGGYIAFTHSAPVSTGESINVNFGWDGGGWGAATATREIPAAIAVRADNFTATEATGTITAVETSPLRLRIDITTRNAANQSLRVTGDAQFQYEKIRSSCS